MADHLVGLAHDHQTVLVLDYGSQYTQLIARRVREQEIFSVLLPGDVSLVRSWAAVRAGPGASDRARLQRRG